jgi:hypothetical protein
LIVSQKKIPISFFVIFNENTIHSETHLANCKSIYLNILLFLCRYVPFSSYSSFTLPDYCQGGSYMLPGHVVSKLLDNTGLTNFVPLEDVLFTGIIGEKIGLKLYSTFTFCYEVSIFSILRDKYPILELQIMH